MTLKQSIEGAKSRLAKWSIGLGSLFIVFICLAIVSQTILRLFGIALPGAEDFVSWSVVGTVFFPLAGTFLAGSHIRLDVLEGRSVRERVRLLREGVLLVIASALIGVLTFTAIQFVWTSFELKERSYGVVSMPMWIPQLSFAVGLVLLVTALVLELVTVLRGETPGFLRSTNEAGQRPKVTGNVTSKER